jgi:aminoglycoside 6'-N-acetyltransferase
VTPGLESFRRLEGARVVLRPLTPADAAHLVAYRSHPDIVRYQAWDSYDAGAASALIAEMAGSAPGRPGRWHQWGIEETASGRLAGDCGLFTQEDRAQGEIGFTLAPEAQGRGLATEAVRLMLGLAFGPLGFRRVVANTDPANARSKALLARLGFRHEGRSIESVRVRGAWVDDDHFALLAREWRG